MSQRSNYAIAVIGIDIGKNSFHVVGQDQRGAIVLRQKWSRGQVDARLANLPPCLIGMEACVGAHHLSRKLHLLGHNARLMPAKYVRPYSKGQKNDFRDAEAIAEAVQRPTMKFVATKTADQLDLQALHRVREALGQPAHWYHQSDPRLPAGAGRCGPARAAFSARRAAGHPGDSNRCPLAPHGAHHRRPVSRLAPPGWAHRRPLRRD
jgi:Transposase